MGLKVGQLYYKSAFVWQGRETNVVIFNILFVNNIQGLCNSDILVRLKFLILIIIISIINWSVTELAIYISPTHSCSKPKLLSQNCSKLNSYQIGR